MCTTITQNLLHARGGGGWSLHFLGRAGSSFSTHHFLFADKTWNGHFDPKNVGRNGCGIHCKFGLIHDVLVMTWFLKSQNPVFLTKNVNVKKNCEDWKMMFTLGSLEHEWFYSLKVLTHFRSKELADFPTYDTHISGATGKHVLRNKYNWTVPPQYVNFITKKLMTV